MTGVKTMRAYVNWGTMSTMITCLPLKIIPPYLMGKSPQKWKGADIMSGTYTTYAGIFVKVIDTKT